MFLVQIVVSYSSQRGLRRTYKLFSMWHPIFGALGPLNPWRIVTQILWLEVDHERCYNSGIATSELPTCSEKKSWVRLFTDRLLVWVLQCFMLGIPQ